MRKKVLVCFKNVQQHCLICKSLLSTEPDSWLWLLLYWLFLVRQDVHKTHSDGFSWLLPSGLGLYQRVLVLIFQRWVIMSAKRQSCRIKWLALKDESFAAVKAWLSITRCTHILEIKTPDLSASAIKPHEKKLSLQQFSSCESSASCKFDTGTGSPMFGLGWLLVPFINTDWADSVLSWTLGTAQGRLHHNQGYLNINMQL